MTWKPAVPTDLLTALEQRIDVVREAGETVSRELQEHESKIEEVRARLSELRKEYDDLSRLRKRYGDDQETLLSALPPTNGRPGARDGFKQLLRRQPNKRMNKTALLDRFVGEVEKERIVTKTADPRKLGATVLGQMIKQQSLIEEGDEIVLIDE